MSELGDMKKAGTVGDNVRGAGATFNSETQEQPVPEIMMTSDYPLLSGVTMVAPSPDWIAGINNIGMIDGGMWIKEIEVTSLGFDAGTDSGATYNAGNTATDPAEAIRVLDQPTDQVYNMDEGKALPMATWKCTMSDGSSDECSGLFRSLSCK